MGKGTPAITNFTAGEWSPKLYGRVDLSRYGQACSELLNMTLMPHGAAARRMGTEFVGMAPEDAGENVRLIPFIFNEDQAYVMEFTPNKIRFFRSGGFLQGKDLETPFTAEDLWNIAYCQSADVMYLASQTRPVQKLARPGVDTFTLEAVTFTGAPKEWKDDNWPGALTFYQQRFWLGGTANEPQKLWASKTGDFENFTTGTDEAAALALALNSERVNAIRWLLGMSDALVVATSGGEWTISGGTSGGPVTNKQIIAKANSNYGSVKCRPVKAGVPGVYVSGDWRRLYDINYLLTDNAYGSEDISLLAEHLTRSGIKELDYCQNPDGIVWCVLKNGGLCGMTYLKMQEVVGWHKHETVGKVLSVCCIPADGYTETWFAVARANGVCIERMKAPWDGETTNEAGCWFVDCGLLYEGEPTKRVSGLEHLEGQTVAVLADGAAHPARVVQDGAIDLEFAAGRVLAGLPYTWALAPMRLEGLSERGTMQGKKTRITGLTARLYKSLGIKWEKPGQPEPPYPLASRDVEMAMDAAPLPFTGDATMGMPGGWDSDARVRLSGDGAFPATVIMLVPNATVNE